MKRLKKIIVTCKQINRKNIYLRNAKKHYQSFIKKKNRKSVKQSEIIICQSKSFENSDMVGINSVVTEYPKTSHKLSKTIRQTEKVGSNSFLYSDTKK